ncbi:hypothetical protein A3835_09615 (plasmid) [Campylobacter concisus]|uniref:Uncharacterized protein n=1 Tax=Campylobacter concisus TaxID=199 RepID=A0A1X0U4P4_9BACT|nr:hypothetical protein A3835_09615 [Campylobacter concisus]
MNFYNCAINFLQAKNSHKDKTPKKNYIIISLFYDFCFFFTVKYFFTNRGQCLFLFLGKNFI